jgi:anti-anti-sigma factor
MEPPGWSSTNEPLTISTVAAGRHIVVEVAGEVDVDTVPVLQAGLALASARAGGDVVVDLSAVSFMSGEGLFEFVKTAESLQRKGSRIVIQRPSAPVAKLLQWTGPPPLPHRDPGC